MSLSQQTKGIIIPVLRMFLFWVNGSHSVKATWSSSGWRRSEPRADILLMIGQSVFCCKRHWASQELSKQEAPSWGITQPVCTHARDRVGQRDWEGRGWALCVCVCVCVCVRARVCKHVWCVSALQRWRCCLEEETREGKCALSSYCC